MHCLSRDCSCITSSTIRAIVDDRFFLKSVRMLISIFPLARWLIHIAKHFFKAQHSTQDPESCCTFQIIEYQRSIEPMMLFFVCFVLLILDLIELKSITAPTICTSQLVTLISFYFDCYFTNSLRYMKTSQFLVYTTAMCPLNNLFLLLSWIL